MALPLSRPTTPPSLAIVGASTRAAAQSAIRAGFAPVTADLFADADLRRIATATRIEPYPEGFLDWLRTIEPPAWMFTGALENHPELVDQLAWIAPLWGNPGDVLARVRSPLELAHTLRRAGLLFPETCSSADGLPHDGTWLTKTYAGASGSGVRELGREQGAGSEEAGRIPGEGVAAESLPLPLSPSPPLFFQRRIEGKPCAAVFVAAEGEATLLGVTRQLIGEEWLGAHGFQYAGSIGPLAISAAARATLQSIGRTLAEEFELTGLFGVDFILTGDELWTIEVNPRYTASVEIVERVTGVHTIALHAAACTGAWSTERGAGNSIDSRLPVPCSPLCSHAKATLFARRDVTITPAFAEWSLGEAARTPWPALADISPAGTPIDTGRPVLTLFAKAANAAETEQQLRARVAEIEQRLYAQS